MNIRKLKESINILERPDKNRFIIIIILSILAGLIDILFSIKVNDIYIDCGQSYIACKNQIYICIILFALRMIISYFVVLYSGFALNKMTESLLDRSAKSVIIDRINAGKTTVSGLHTITHDIPHYTNLFYNSLILLVIELFMVVPLAIYFLFIANDFFRLILFLIGTFCIITVFAVKKYLEKNSLIIQKFSKEISEKFQLAIKQSKEYFASNLLELLLVDFKKPFRIYSTSISIMFVGSAIQKNVVETIALFSILICVLIFSGSNIIINSEMITALIILIYRIAPSIGRILSAITNIRLSESSVSRLCQTLNVLPNVNKYICSNGVLSNTMVSDQYQITLDSNSNWSINLLKDKGIIWVTGNSGVGKSQFLESIFIKREHSPILSKYQPILGPSVNLVYVPQFPENNRNTIRQYLTSFGVIEYVRWHLIDENIISEDSISNARAGVSDLSGGEKYRVALERAFASTGSILIVDEPLASLDSKLCQCVLEQLISISKDRLIFIISHQRIDKKNLFVEYKELKIEQVNRLL